MTGCSRRFPRGCLPLLLCVFATDAFDGSDLDNHRLMFGVQVF